MKELDLNKMPFERLVAYRNEVEIFYSNSVGETKKNWFKLLRDIKDVILVKCLDLQEQIKEEDDYPH